MNSEIIYRNIWTDKQIDEVRQLSGPILIIGASGFIGANLFHGINQIRNDVYACSPNPQKSWRLAGVSNNQLVNLDILDYEVLHWKIKKLKPATIFNLVAYGAYSKQKEYNKIYSTNFTANINVIEILKKIGFSAYIHAGSSSEYGLNADAPTEDVDLIPNSHYAVSKAAFYYALKYYGKVEKLPVLNLRLYSVYGPLEEPDRLMPVLIYNARKGKLPAFVHSNISRDFIFISDVISAFITAALLIKPEFYGNAYNVGTGIKTTIKELAEKTIDIFKLNVKPLFGSMEDRKWDLSDWYANITNITKDFKWEPLTDLKDGIIKTSVWQEEIDFNNVVPKNIS